MPRSKSTSILKKSKKIVNTSLKDINSLFKKTSNTILGLASKGFKTLKSKIIKSKKSRKTRRR